MATDLSGLKVNERNFAPDYGQKAIPVYADKLNDVIDNIETEQNLVYTTDGTIVSGQEPKVEYGDEVYHRTVIEGTFLDISDITNLQITSGVLTGATTAFGAKIFDFPEGGIHVCGAVFDLVLSGVAGHPVAAYIGLGTVQATGATSTLDNGTGYEDIVDGYSGGITATTAGTDYHRVAGAENDADALDGTTTAVDMYLNVASTWQSCNGAYTIAGKISFNWSFLGDIPL